MIRTQKNNRFSNIYPIKILTLSLAVILLLFSHGYIVSLSWAENRGIDWYINSSDDIQTIIDNASYSDTVYLKSGNYETEMIVMKEGVSLKALPKDLGSVVVRGRLFKPVIWAKSHCTIENLIIRNGSYGIRCPKGDIEGITIKNNLIIDNDTGISIESSGCVSIINTTVVYNRLKGLVISIDPNIPCLDCETNIIAFNGPVLEEYSGQVWDIEFKNKRGAGDLKGFFLELSERISLCYNDIFSYNNIFTSMMLTANDEIIEGLYDFDFFGPGNLSKDPCFIDPNNADFHLLSYSPCVDRGDPNKGYSLEPEPNGKRVNLGFYGNTPQAVTSEDSDEDGIYDFLEGAGNMDKDLLMDWEDGDTVIIPLSGDAEKISLYCKVLSGDPNNHNSGLMGRFKGTKRLSPAEYAVKSPKGKLPYGIIEYTLTGLSAGDRVMINMLFPEYFRAIEKGGYMALSSDGSWEAVSFDTLAHENGISFIIEDGGPGDYDAKEDETIDHRAALVIPRTIDIENPGVCFISSAGVY